MAKKTIIIVGAGKGVGVAIGRVFASHDFRVALIARSQEHLDAFAQQYKKEGIEVYTKVADALYPETLTKALNELREELGTPDVLVYNVGNITPDGDREITCEFLLERYQIDVASGYHCASLVATEEFAKKKGVIIFTGGALGYHTKELPIPNHIPLSIDKAALNAVNIILHKMYEPRGIFVGSVMIREVIDGDNPKYTSKLCADQFWTLYNERNEYIYIY